MEDKNDFGVVDYCAFAGVLIITSGIGLFFSYKGNKSPEEFLMGNRSLHPLPVSMSLLTSFISAISILGYSGEAYANGIQLFMYVFGGMLGIIFSSLLLMPIIYPLKLTSINEYLLLRFKSKTMRTFLSFVMLIKILFLSGIALYAPTIALSSITKLSTLGNIFLLGIICTTYSAFGGIRAVIWTDVFQYVVMMIGLITVIAVGCVLKGGIIEILRTASIGGRLEIFNMSPSPFVRHTFFNTATFGFLNYARTYSVEQYNIQRVCAVKSLKEART